MAIKPAGRAVVERLCGTTFGGHSFGTHTTTGTLPGTPRQTTLQPPDATTVPPASAALITFGG